jgi:hypothetical protein
VVLVHVAEERASASERERRRRNRGFREAGNLKEEEEGFTAARIYRGHTSRC